MVNIDKYDANDEIVPLLDELEDNVLTDEEIEAIISRHEESEDLISDLYLQKEDIYLDPDAFYGQDLDFND